MSTTTRLLGEARQLQRKLAVLGRRWECDRSKCDGLPHEGWLHHHARADQQEPASYRTWALVTGRGYGKTRTGAETIKKWGVSRRGHFAVIAKNDREVRSICFEGPAGLLSVIDPNDVAKDGYSRSSGGTSLRLKNGTLYSAFTAETPDNLRGYAFDGAWFDEFSSWPDKTAQDIVDNMWFCLRESIDPRVLITTTPKPVPHLVKLLQRAEGGDNHVVVTRGSTMDNAANLSGVALDELIRDYDGTRLGRQELHGELLTDVEGALWTPDIIDDYRVSEPPDEMAKVYVAVDPAITSTSSSDETGIITVGGDRSRNYWVLSDASIRTTPDGWVRRAIAEYEEWSADCILVEANQGGDAWASMIHNVDPTVNTRKVHASISKRLRAEPVAALYEQGRVHHVGMFAKLEDQLTTWTPFDKASSPDRLDALVWGIGELQRAVKQADVVVPFGATRASPWKIN